MDETAKSLVMKRRRETARERLHVLADALQLAQGADVLPTIEDGPGSEGGPAGYSETLKFTGRVRRQIVDLTEDVATALRLLDQQPEERLGSIKGKTIPPGFTLHPLSKMQMDVSSPQGAQRILDDEIDAWIAAEARTRARAEYEASPEFRAQQTQLSVQSACGPFGLLLIAIAIGLYVFFQLGLLCEHTRSNAWAAWVLVAVCGFGAYKAFHAGE